MQTAVRKLTRLDYQAPKQKHVDTLVSIIRQRPMDTGDMMTQLQRRLKENSWIIVFKVLIIAHALIRETDGDCVLEYLEHQPALLDTARLREKSSNAMQIQNIHAYGTYLRQRVASFREIHIDYVKTVMTSTSKTGRLRYLSVSDGLLRETEVLQRQIEAVLACKIHVESTDNAISLHAYRLVVEDLMKVFQAANEAIVNILEHYFAMSKTDAKRSLEIYKRFARQTNSVVEYMDSARRIQGELKMNIPALKHAPLSLANALEEYLNDPDFDKKAESKVSEPVQPSTAPPPPPPLAPVSTNSAPLATTRPGNENIDFFDSLDNHQALITHMPNGSSFVTSQPTGSHVPVIDAPTGLLRTASTGPGNNPFRTSFQIPDVGQVNRPLSSASTGLGSAQTSNPFRSSTLPLPQRTTWNTGNANLLGIQPYSGIQADTGYPQNMPKNTPIYSQFTGSVQQNQWTGASSNPFINALTPQPTGNPFVTQQVTSPQPQPSFATWNGTSNI